MRCLRAFVTLTAIGYKSVCASSSNNNSRYYPLFNPKKEMRQVKRLFVCVYVHTYIHTYRVWLNSCLCDIFSKTSFFLIISIILSPLSGHVIAGFPQVTFLRNKNVIIIFVVVLAMLKFLILSD